ncbi:helix-turn-helix domain-containing protein [Streptomyces tauricus]|uniref:Helix-turn-helix domain-containing protein n=1 Tax=Streptomyces tauricus TaxID=68274 RepID=A0ABZ1JGH1_9ACTN|nr:helix-turn-helix domain-containing protein [Streptomyces tauricus]
MPGKKGKRVNAYTAPNNPALLERRLKAFEYRKQGRSLRSIAKELGVSYTTVSNDIQKCLDEYLLPAVDSYRRQMLAEVDDQLVRLYGYMETPQYITSPRGDIVRGPDGNPLLDREYYLKIEDRISRQLEIRAKLLGAYAPSQTELTVHQVDSTDLAIADLIAQQRARTALAKEEFKAGQQDPA